LSKVNCRVLLKHRVHQNESECAECQTPTIISGNLFFVVSLISTRETKIRLYECSVTDRKCEVHEKVGKRVLATKQRGEQRRVAAILLVHQRTATFQHHCTQKRRHASYLQVQNCPIAESVCYPAFRNDLRRPPPVRLSVFFGTRLCQQRRADVGRVRRQNQIRRCMPPASVTRIIVDAVADHRIQKLSQNLSSNTSSVKRAVLPIGLLTWTDPSAKI